MANTPPQEVLSGTFFRETIEQMCRELPLQSELTLEELYACALKWSEYRLEDALREAARLYHGRCGFDGDHEQMHKVYDFCIEVRAGRVQQLARLVRITRNQLLDISV